MLPPVLALLCAVCAVAAGEEYEVPEATLIAYKPRGLHVSIPDSKGVELFAFHGNVNKEMGDREAGEMSKDVLRSKNGRWIFEDNRIRLKEGDVINYWLYVQVDRKGYPKDFLTWTVPALVEKTTQPKPETQPPSVTQPTCQSTATTVNGQKTCKGQLIFEESFDSLQDSKWEHMTYFGTSPGFPFVLYSRDDKNCFVSNGNLHIAPSLLPDEIITTGKMEISGCTGTPGSDECYRQASAGYYVPPVQTAQLRTRQSFSFRYGKVEIRAKLPLGDWIYPELQLKPTNSIYGSNPRLASGQVNLALARGNRELNANGQDFGAKILESSCEMGFGDAMHRETVKRTGPSFWGDSFHVYGLIWTPAEMVFMVDGDVVGKVAAPNGGFQSEPQFSAVSNVPWAKGTNFAPFDQEFYFSLGLAVGGFSEFPDDCVSADGHKIPWKNREPKAIAKFWNDRNSWFSTWQPQTGSPQSHLEVDYIKVYAL